MKVNQKIKTLVSTILVVIFLGYYAGATLFNHTHTYEWGKVTHSHPYLPSAAHSHTAASLQTIDNQTQLEFTTTTIVVIIALVLTAPFLYAVKKESIANQYWNHCNLRAPPISL